MHAEEREQIAEAARELAASGLVRGTSGNLSLRVGDDVVVTPTGARLGSLRADDVAVIGLDGEHRWGPLRATSELDLHLVAYRDHGAGAVVHSHPPAATAVSCLELDELPLVHYELLRLGGAVRIARFAPFGTPELAELVGKALRDGRQAALMASHGATVIGGDLAGAIDQTELLEWCCDVFLRARAAGAVRVLDAGQVQAVIDAAVARSYGTTHAASHDRSEA